MKRFFSLLIIIAVALLTVSCGGGDIDTSELKTYSLDGVEFSLPRYMRRTVTQDYEASFDNLIIYFSVKKVTDSMLQKMGVEREDGAEAYANALLEKNNLDDGDVYYENLKHRELISFRYMYDVSEGEGEQNNILYYVVLAGSMDNFWYFEMCCPESVAAENIGKFDSWRNDIILTK